MKKKMVRHNENELTNNSIKPLIDSICPAHILNADIHNVTLGG